MKIARNIKGIRIDWLRVAAALGASTPYGPIIGPDGTIYWCDGQVLVTGSEAAAAAAPELRGPAARPVRQNPRPTRPISIDGRRTAAA
jgi:hypothetical protein